MHSLEVEMAERRRAMTFGEWALTRRLAVGKTQGEVGECIGHAGHYVSQVEHGRIKGMPEPDKLELWCRCLETTREDLLTSLGYLVEDEQVNEQAYQFTRLMAEIDRVELPEDAKAALRSLLTFARRNANSGSDD